MATGRVVLALLALLTVGLAVVDVADGEDTDSPLAQARGAAATVLGPAQEGADALGRAGSAAWGELSGGADGESARLRSQNAELAARLAEADDARTRSEGLTGLAGATGAWSSVTGRAIAVRAEPGGAWTATLDVGSDDGVQASTTVLVADGLVGRVRSVSASTSEVLLLADPRSGVGVRLETSGQLGTAQGTGQPGTLALTLLDPQADLAVGDRVVTLGSDGGRPFVPGVVLGEVTSVDSDPGAVTRTATLRLAVDPTRLDVVAVVQP